MPSQKADSHVTTVLTHRLHVSIAGALYSAPSVELDRIVYPRSARSNQQMAKVVCPQVRRRVGNGPVAIGGCALRAIAVDVHPFEASTAARYCATSTSAAMHGHRSFTATHRPCWPSPPPFEWHRAASPPRHRWLRVAPSPSLPPCSAPSTFGLTAARAAHPRWEAVHAAIITP